MNSMRPRVRRIASRQENASCGRLASVKAACARRSAAGRRFVGEVVKEQRARRLAKRLPDGNHQRGDQEDPEHGQCPEPRGEGSVPAEQQQEQQRGGLEAAPEVVEDLPPGKARERVPPADAVGAGNARQQPPGDLPIPPDPPVTAPRVVQVAGRVFLEQLHVAHQPRPGVAAFEQVVAQDPVLREPPPEGRLECVHVVDPLADEGALAEQVLVYVRDGARVGVDARLSPEQLAR